MLDIFSPSDWERIRNEYEGWWTQEREQPVIHLAFDGVDPGMKRPEGLVTEDLYRYSLEEPAEKIAEKLEYILRSRKYEFQGYPHIWMNYGPMYCVDFLGCRPTIGENTVWFSPEKKVPPKELTIRPDPDSVFLPRELAIRKAIDERFGGGYVISGWGGNYGINLDILAEFYGPEELTYMLYDEPEEAYRLMEEAAQALEKINKKISPLTPNAIGYTSWGGIFAPESWSTSQCDYCAMVGPNVFDKFVIDDLRKCFEESPKYNYYHLDGPGEIIHMDKILAIPELRCMQWIAPPNTDPSVALDVCERIYKAGKNIWATGPIEQLAQIADRNGTAKGIYWYGTYPMSEYDRIMRIVDDLMNNH